MASVGPCNSIVQPFGILSQSKRFGAGALVLELMSSSLTANEWSKQLPAESRTEHLCWALHDAAVGLLHLHSALIPVRATAIYLGILDDEKCVSRWSTGIYGGTMC